MNFFVQNIMTWYFQVHAGTPRLPPACPFSNPAQLANSLGDSGESVPAILEKAWTTREVNRDPYHTSHHHLPTLDCCSQTDYVLRRIAFLFQLRVDFPRRTWKGF